MTLVGDAGEHARGPAAEVVARLGPPASPPGRPPHERGDGDRRRGRAVPASTCGSPAASPCGVTASTWASWSASTRTSTSSASRSQHEELMGVLGRARLRREPVREPDDAGPQLQFVRREAVRAAWPRWRPPRGSGRAGGGAGARRGRLVPRGRRRRPVPRVRSSTTSTSSSTSCAWTTTSTSATRLEVDEYAISPVDALIAKAQIGRINQKDVHDIIALFKDLPLRERRRRPVDLRAAHRRAVRRRLGPLHRHHGEPARGARLARRLRLSERGDRARVHERVTAVLEAIEDEEKTRRWQWRARIGKRSGVAARGREHRRDSGRRRAAVSGGPMVCPPSSSG